MVGLLNTVRNEMEHNFWSVPQVQYRIEQERVAVIEPEIMGQTVSDFARSSYRQNSLLRRRNLCSRDATSYARQRIDH